jgi:hypothetical protein
VEHERVATVTVGPEQLGVEKRNCQHGDVFSRHS